MFVILIVFRVPIKMTNSSEEMEKPDMNSGNNMREESEYVRLVISNEVRLPEAGILQPRAETRKKSFFWWLKALIFFVITIIFLLIFLKWGVPFMFEKVRLSFIYIFQLLYFIYVLLKW